MKITGLRTQLFEFPTKRAVGDANSPEGRSKAAALAIFLETDSDLTGISIGSPAAKAQIASLSELLVGKDPRRVRGLWKQMVDRVFKVGNEGIASNAISALDIAVWDLKAKANDEPLWQTLGAASPRVKAYASGIESPLDDQQLFEFYQGLASKGVNAGKLKVGLDVEADLRRIGVMSEALATSGKNPELMIDSNEYWSPKQAIRIIRRFEEQFDLTWCEEPARRWDYRGLRRVSQSITAAVATGENLKTINDFVPLISNEAVDVVQVGFGTSGITGAMQVADLAYGFELPVAMMNSPVNLMAHLAAALPNHMMLEVVDLGWDTVFKTEQRIEDGWLVLGNSPGLGIEIDDDALTRFSVNRISPEAKPSPWGRRRGAGLYLVPPSEPREFPDD